MKNTCPVCKKQHNNKKYCSRICQGKDIELSLEIQKTTWKRCPVCNKKHKNATFCSNKCKITPLNDEVKRRARRYKNCSVCGIEFRVKRRGQVYCSSECNKRTHTFNNYYLCDLEHSCLPNQKGTLKHSTNHLHITKDQAHLLGLIFRFGKIDTHNSVKFYAEKEDAIKEIREILQSNYPIYTITRPIVGFSTKVASENFLDHLIDLGFSDYHFHHFPPMKPELWGVFIKAYLKWSPTRLDSAGKTWFLVPSTKIAYQLRDVGFKIFNDGRWWVG